jgi:hypoxanthine phosphoribosyltransferase
MPELIPVLTAAEIHRLVQNMAQRISEDYRGRDLMLIGVLKGSFIFLSDLIRLLSIPVKIDFLQAASYGTGTDSSGTIQILKGINLDIRGNDVLLVEDIVDTGLTIRWILDHLRSFQPRSLSVCALIDKRERREIDVQIAYAGHRVESGFLVGYGLDYAEQYRQLPGIYHLNL